MGNWCSASGARLRPLAAVVLGAAIGFTFPPSLRGQIESIESPPQRFHWVGHGRLEGHLALNYSPAAAFSPDSSTLAVVNEDKVVLMDLRQTGIRKVLRPRLETITDLEIQSANFLAASRLWLLATGLIRSKEKRVTGRTPLLAFQWDTNQDALVGKLNAVGSAGSYGIPRFFPEIGYLALYKDSTFDLWQPASGRGGRINLPDLKNQPNLYEFSPDGHWLLLAQIAASSTADPVVVRLSEHRFVDSLRGHQGTVLGIAFSRDSKKVVTACEDGRVRIWSVTEWKLLQTLAGHRGPVHWAEFSADGKWVASAGEDKTVRIWGAEEGKLAQTLEESKEPVRTVTFSPGGDYVAASSEQTVLIWQRRRVD